MRDIIRLMAYAACSDEIEVGEHLELLMDREYRHLSTGERQFLIFHILLQLPTDLLILDEPTMGLDSRVRKHVLEVLRKTKKTAIVAYHNFWDVLHSCSRGYVICDGSAIELRIEGSCPNPQFVELNVVEGDKTVSSRILDLKQPRAAEDMNDHIFPIVESIGQSNFVATHHIRIRYYANL